MANALYSKGKEALLGTLDLSAANLKIVLVDTGAYTPALTTDAFLSDIPAPARIVTSGNLAGKTITLGVFDATDVDFGNVDNNPTIEAGVLYEDTGTAGTSRLIYYFDTGNGLPLPADLNNADLQLIFDNGANKIFAI